MIVMIIGICGQFTVAAIPQDTILPFQRCYCVFGQFQLLLQKQYCALHTLNVFVQLLKKVVQLCKFEERKSKINKMHEYITPSALVLVHFEKFT